MKRVTAKRILSEIISTEGKYNVQASLKSVSVKRSATIDISSGAETKFSKENRNAIMEALLKSVDPDQRVCLVLRNVEGLSYKEISEALKININTVRSRLKRAREKLLALKKVRVA